MIAENGIFRLLGGKEQIWEQLPENPVAILP